MGATASGAEGTGRGAPARGTAEGKKNVYWQTRYGKIEVVEQIFRQGTKGPEIRPFTPSAEVVCRGCSEPLQRAIVDFGADAAGARIPQKLKEHYGIEVSARTCWPIVLRHAAAIEGRPQAVAQIPERDGVAQRMYLQKLVGMKAD